MTESTTTERSLEQRLATVNREHIGSTVRVTACGRGYTQLVLGQVGTLTNVDLNDGEGTYLVTLPEEQVKWVKDVELVNDGPAGAVPPPARTLTQKLARVSTEHVGSVVRVTRASGHGGAEVGFRATLVHVDRGDGYATYRVRGIPGEDYGEKQGGMDSEYGLWCSDVDLVEDDITRDADPLIAAKDAEIARLLTQVSLLSSTVRDYDRLREAIPRRLREYVEDGTIRMCVDGANAFLSEFGIDEVRTEIEHVIEVRVTRTFTINASSAVERSEDFVTASMSLDSDGTPCLDGDWWGEESNAGEYDFTVDDVSLVE